MYTHKELLEPDHKEEDISPEFLMERYEWATMVLGLHRVREFPKEVFENMVEDKWVALENHIPISNTVCNGFFMLPDGSRAQIHLAGLALPLMNYGVQINTASFPAVTFPATGTVQAQVVLFATGKMVITGFVCPSEMHYSVEFVRGLLERCGYQGIRFDVSDLTVENVVARLCVPAPVIKSNFRVINPSADSSSEFPGLFVQFVRSNPDGPDRKWTVLVFDGDSCVFVGWRTKQELVAMYYLISPMLYLATELKRDGEKEKHPLYAYVQEQINRGEERANKEA